MQDLKKEFTPFKFLVILLSTAISIYLLQILWQFLANFSDIIVVLVMAWLLSFILEPVVDFISKFLKFSKVWSALLTYLFFAVIFTIGIFVFIPQIIAQFESLSKIIPQYLVSYPKFIQTWNNTVTNSLDTIISLIPSLATIFINIIFVLFLSFYFIIDKEKINAEIYKLSPKSWHKHLIFIQKVIDDTFSAFLRIQVIFGIISGIATWIVLRISGVDFAASIALLAGILTIIPLIGPILALIPPVFIALATNPNNPTQALLIFTILILIQQVIFNFIGPKLMGKAFKLHPIVVFLSIIIGFKVAGALGAIFIVPVLGIFVIVLKELGHYFINPSDSSDKK
nr:AI-2E family transporter [Candidatus Levybacteria bacterium]